MYPFFETVRIEDGEIANLAYHQERIEHTFYHFYPSDSSFILKDVLNRIPQKNGVFKGRIVYNQTDILDVSFSPYTPRTIHTLKFIENNEIDYSYKSSNRDQLIHLIEKKGLADEIIIIKKGLITDTSYSNLAFFDGEEWFTPTLPLLKGTMRQFLLDTHQLHEKDITQGDCKSYQKISFINAMMPLGTCQIEINDQTFLK